MTFSYQAGISSDTGAICAVVGRANPGYFLQLLLQQEKIVLFLQTPCGRKWKGRETMFKSQLALSLLEIKPRASHVPNMNWATLPASSCESQFTLLWNGNTVNSWNGQSSQSLLSYMNPSVLAGWDLLEVMHGCCIWHRMATSLPDEFWFWWWVFLMICFWWWWSTIKMYRTELIESL